MENNKKSFRKYCLLYCFSLLVSANTTTYAATIGERIKSASFSKVAIVVYPQTDVAKKLVRSAQSRVENILLDNGITVLDQNKVKELKDVWNNLEDPGYFVTADDFVENTEKYKLDGIIRLYLTAESKKGLASFYVATAQVDVRFVASDAQVQTHTTPAMGIPGNPPSDGLTQTAALVNAVQRAVDKAASKVGLEVISFAAPRALSFELKKSEDIVPMDFNSGSDPSASFVKFAKLSQNRWKKEDATCAVAAGSGGLAAVGGYVKETDISIRSRLSRVYGSIMHIVNVKDGTEITTFEAEPIGRRKKHEKARSKILDCRFLSSWRYLAAVSGNYVFLWDIERGLVMTKLHIEGGLSEAQLAYANYQNKDYIGVRSNDDKLMVFEIIRKKG